MPAGAKTGMRPPVSASDRSRSSSPRRRSAEYVGTRRGGGDELGAYPAAAELHREAASSAVDHALSVAGSATVLGGGVIAGWAGAVDAGDAAVPATASGSISGSAAEAEAKASQFDLLLEDAGSKIREAKAEARAALEAAAVGTAALRVSDEESVSSDGAGAGSASWAGAGYAAVPAAASGSISESAAAAAELHREAAAVLLQQAAEALGPSLLQKARKEITAATDAEKAAKIAATKAAARTASARPTAAKESAGTARAVVSAAAESESVAASGRALRGRAEPPRATAETSAIRRAVLEAAQLSERASKEAAKAQAKAVTAAWSAASLATRASVARDCGAPEESVRWLESAAELAQLCEREALRASREAVAHRVVAQVAAAKLGISESNSVQSRVRGEPAPKRARSLEEVAAEGGAMPDGTSSSQLPPASSLAFPGRVASSQLHEDLGWDGSVSSRFLSDSGMVGLSARSVISHRAQPGPSSAPSLAPSFPMRFTSSQLHTDGTPLHARSTHTPSLSGSGPAVSAAAAASRSEGGGGGGGGGGGAGVVGRAPPPAPIFAVQVVTGPSTPSPPTTPRAFLGGRDPGRAGDRRGGGAEAQVEAAVAAALAAD